MGKNYTSRTIESTHLTAEIEFTFSSTRFDEDTVRKAIQNQFDKYKDDQIMYFVSTSVPVPIARRSITARSDWIKNSSPLSRGKWSSIIKKIADEIVKNVKKNKYPKFIGCELRIIDRTDGTKTPPFKIT